MKQAVESEHLQKRFHQDASVKTGLDWNSQITFPVAIISTLGRKQILSLKFGVLIYTIYLYMFMNVHGIIAHVFERKGW